MRGLLGLVFACASASALGAQPAQPPWSGENLQHYPRDITRPELIQRMREFSFALGIGSCQYCHTGGDGVSFDGVVFPSDQKPAKVKARAMLHMMASRPRRYPGAHAGVVRALGVECLHCHVAGQWTDAAKPTFEFARRMMRMVDGLNAGPLKEVRQVTCWTCHRGQRLPARLPRIKWEKVLADHEAEFDRQEDRGLAMRIYTASLGVDCSHCHEAGDFAAATKPPKAMVAKMLLIFDEIPNYFDNSQETGDTVLHVSPRHDEAGTVRDATRNNPRADPAGRLQGGRSHCTVSAWAMRSAIVRQIEADETIVDLIPEMVRPLVRNGKQNPRDLRRHHPGLVALPGGFGWRVLLREAQHGSCSGEC